MQAERSAGDSRPPQFHLAGHLDQILVRDRHAFGRARRPRITKSRPRIAPSTSPAGRGPHGPTGSSATSCKRGNGRDLGRARSHRPPSTQSGMAASPGNDQGVETHPLEFLAQVGRRQVRIERQHGCVGSRSQRSATQLVARAEERYRPARSEPMPTSRSCAPICRTRRSRSPKESASMRHKQWPARQGRGQRDRPEPRRLSRACPSRANPGRRLVKVPQKADASGRHH